jgi:hypothetical protein
MATTDLAITDTPLGRIRAIAIIMRQHGPRIMRIGRAGKEVKAAASWGLRAAWRCSPRSAKRATDFKATKSALIMELRLT